MSFKWLIDWYVWTMYTPRQNAERDLTGAAEAFRDATDALDKSRCHSVLYYALYVAGKAGVSRDFALKAIETAKADKQEGPVRISDRKWSKIVKIDPWEEGNKLRQEVIEAEKAAWEARCRYRSALHTFRARKGLKPRK